MNKAIFLLIPLVCNSALAQQDFLSQQKKYPRVRTALAEKEQTLVENLREKGCSIDDLHLLITAFKAEKQLEIYARKKNGTDYRLIAVYDICASSGKLGPKRQQGDGQVPEGFYTIDRFNPASNFYLSLGVSYPNRADRRKSKAANPGGDIFIHGSCVTIGCLPMTDDRMKEIYLYALFARSNGQSDIPVHIFPFRMTDANLKAYQNRYAGNRELTDFWTNLKTGYDRFLSSKKDLNISVDTSGNYLF